MTRGHPRYEFLAQESRAIAGDTIDAERLNEWMDLHRYDDRDIFLHSQDLDYVDQMGNKHSPLQKTVLNDDRNEWLVACKEAYFGSASYDRLSNVEKMAKLKSIGLPPTLKVGA